MAAAKKSSLVGRAGAAARKVVSRSSGDTAQKAPAKRAADEEAPAEKAVAKAAAAKKAPAKKAATKKSATKKAATKKAATSKAPAKKAPAKKTATKKTATKKAPASKAAATKKAPATTKAAKTTTTKKTTTEKAPATKKAPATTKQSAATTLVVLDREDPWTESELAAVREQLGDDVDRLRAELAEIEGDLAGMIENPGEGAGHDQADVGSSSFERDQERQIVNNARDMLEQSQHALERIHDGSYGQCEGCGNAIGKNRLMAFPRATLCLTCKQREERR